MGLYKIAMAKYASGDFNGFQNEAERFIAAQRLLLNAAMDIEAREKNSFKNLFQKSPKIYYEMGINDDNQPVGRYYQKINGKIENIQLKDDVSRLALLCMALKQYNNKFKGVRGEFRPDMFNKTYTMFKQKPNARITIASTV